MKVHELRAILDHVPRWTEHRPIVDGEVTRWRYRFETGASLEAVLREDDQGRRGVRLSTRPGTCRPATADPAELYLAAAGLVVLGDWLAATEPAPDEQPTLFDPQPEEAARG